MPRPSGHSPAGHPELTTATVTASQTDAYGGEPAIDTDYETRPDKEAPRTNLPSKSTFSVASKHSWIRWP